MLDVDTGYDDALALLLAVGHPGLDVLGVTCVAGNQRLPQVVTNTLKILEVTGQAIPVALGMDRPLVEELRPPAPLHGQDGMADLDLPPPRSQPLPIHAVEFMAQTLRKSPQPVTLVALAPLTNLAVFLRMYPELAQAKIRQIVSMAGTFAAFGNTSPLAEFNARQDPEAAAIVLESGLPVRLYPLDVFRMIRFDRGEIDHFMAGPTPAAQAAGRIMHFAVNYFQADWSLIGDAGAVATLIDPAHCTVERHPVTVDLCSPISRGATIFDRRPPSTRRRTGDWWTVSPAQIEVITDLDPAPYRRLFANSLGMDVA